ncbi:MAG: glycosyltransferase family 2 protein [Spirosomataceae bacterium]
MKVSIITVCFRAEKTIEECILSVLEQTYSPIEYIIIDGASTDGTLAIIQSFGGQITKVISEPDRGIYDAMNKGIQIATGDIIGILNADDVYAHKYAIEHVVNTFSQTKSQAVYADLVYMDASLQRVTRYWKSGSYHDGDFLLGWMPPHPTFFVKKEVYKHYGNFRTDLKIAADYELMLRFIHKHGIQVAYLSDILVKMREGGISNASLGNRFDALKEDKLAWEVNGLKPFFYTHWFKPLRKVTQFLNTKVTV